MGVAVKHIGSKSEAEILAMNSSDPQWYDKGFYYPNDDPVIPYFYRVLNGSMEKYCDPESVGGIGVTLNGKTIGGVKSLIEYSDTLYIPLNYEYNVVNLQIDGTIINDGSINVL